MKSHLLSVVIPVYNGEKFILECLENIQNQRVASLEILVVDDGSTDRTRAIAEKCSIPLRYFYQSNQGPAAARNRGIEEAKGEFLCFQDVDDLFPQNVLPKLIDTLTRNPGLDRVRGFTQTVVWEAQKRLWESIDHPIDRWIALTGGVFRRETFDKFGWLRTDLHFSEDLDWTMHARARGLKESLLNEIALFYRLHGNNMTRGKSLQEMDTLAVLRRGIQEKRKKRD